MWPGAGVAVRRSGAAFEWLGGMEELVGIGVKGVWRGD